RGVRDGGRASPGGPGIPPHAGGRGPAARRAALRLEEDRRPAGGRSPARGRCGVTLVAGILAGLAVLLAAWSYLAYPAVIERLAGKAAGSRAGGTGPADVEIVVPAADEEDVIEARMRNLLEQEAPVAARIALGCDGCRDRTAALARAALGGRGRVVEFE